ncbi:MAG: hypothetical protein IAE81_11475 [Caldilineaceae bacterium]|nr:hypothetical protein [Caldilineaceae bacterium]
MPDHKSVPDHELAHARHSAATRTAVDESADALRRRADALLDEMMLNGVDIAGGDATHEPSFLSGEALDATYINGFTENGIHQHEPMIGQGSALYAEEQPRAEREDARPMENLAASDSALSASPAWRQPHPESLFAPIPDDQPQRDAQLTPAEARYARPASPPADYAATLGNGHPPQGSSAVRRQSASLASTMTVGGRANLRSTLLPRAIEVDVDTAAQEITALLSEISATLPVGNEAAERGRHLLNKAQNILQNDPSRTAEVDYYLQQVRRIVQRTRQTNTYSTLYHRRLILYLAAWAALAITVLAARYLLQAELLALLEEFFWTDGDAPWVQYGPMVIDAFFAGALGAALGVLLNMRRHAAKEYGYFDRKYGLRGLLLPLLGAVFGLLLALLWTTACRFLGLDGANFWVGLLPALAAFVAGFGQEWLYGAR